MITVYMYRRQGSYGYLCTGTFEVATQEEADAIIANVRNTNPYAFATTTPVTYTTRKTYRRSYRKY